MEHNHSAYNKVNGDWACENEETLHTDLRSTLGFQGFIVSDWGARHDVGASVNATLDMDMPGGGSGGYDDADHGSKGQRLLDDDDDD